MIAFAILIAILIYIAKRSKRNPPYMSKQQSINTPNVTFYENEEDIENKIKAIDANFNREEFLAWSKDVFVKLQMAWTKHDWEEIRLYETNELFEIKVEPNIPKRFIGIVTIDKKTPNYSVKKLVEMITAKK